MPANIVVADAGPLHYLVLIDCAEILVWPVNIHTGAGTEFVEKVTVPNLVG